MFSSSPKISFESKNSFFIISHHNLKLIIDPNSGLNLILAINQKVFSPSYYPSAGQSAKKQANVITTVWYCNPAQHFASCHCHTGRQNKAVRNVLTRIVLCTRWDCTEAVQSFKSFCFECLPNINGNLVTSKPEIPSVVRNWLLKVNVKTFHSNSVLSTSSPASGAVRFDNADNEEVGADRWRQWTREIFQTGV